MAGDDLKVRLVRAYTEHQPEFIAVTSKSALEYLDFLDSLSLPGLTSTPHVFRCQNTVLHHRFGPRANDIDFCRQISRWFRIACDPRWSLILVQTLDDIDLIRQHLAPTRIEACPYGYDPAVFDADLPTLERTVDVGCYMNLKNMAGRIRLVAAARAICERHGYTFRFESGFYWHAYARLIRSTRIHLHWAEHGEVPYRLYETTVFGTVFVTNPLFCGVERLFTPGQDYLTIQPDLSDLESVLLALLENTSYQRSIGLTGQERARAYTWPHIADAYVAPALRDLLTERIV
jgi:hypothetical protein